VLATLASSLPTWSHALVRVDAVTVVMALLVSFIGWVVVRYSKHYMAGDPRQREYNVRLLATVAAVFVVVITNNLAVLIAAWAATSLAMHGLLTFYGERPVAVAVAHKKFLLARAADVSMVGAAVAFVTAYGTLRIDGIVAAATVDGSLPTAARVGAVLLVVTAVLKCAQIPFHGWLIQVMEAPTPVSALLHAGVVNLGGFVLLRFSGVIDLSTDARTVAVVVGTLTAVVAGLVMTTRISVKVALAWSTCAQMGVMLLQCGLGLWEMALLHLVAHSLYKAHAFLGAGGTVRQTDRRRLGGPVAPPRLATVLAGVATSAALTAAVTVVWVALPFTSDLSPAFAVMLGVVALAMVPVAVPRQRAGGALRVAGAVAVPVVYLVLHELAAELVTYGSEPPIALVAFTGAAFLALFTLRTACLVRPHGRLVRRTRPWVYAGFFLDEAFTRVAFTISPPRPPAAPDSPLPTPVAHAVVPTAARVPAAR